MNNNRRKAISRVIEQLEIIKNDIEVILDEEQDSFDSMPENLQDSERGQVSQDAIDNLESAVDSIEEVLESLNEAAT
jgi:hypothetical protein